ncbi:iduronate-2-sulfatase [Seminavis robusta]|uniref:Iduronate-2-sulfatase n=1 Tax=Seminavis robusta TaxID=568900 RepID=A0A9N8E716_9STRA|nr:iduronate-2-sulfatase [Seminavis robusta]|eukprot:Sro691_g187780.1 iduronate-2-sulfatase (265) ;mRNA; r:11463-12257
MAGRCDVTELPEGLQPAEIRDINFRMCWDNDHNLGEGCNSSGKFESLQAQHSPGLEMDIFGPEMALAHALSPRLKEQGIQRAHFIKFAMGSTNLHSNWNPSNNNSEGKMASIGYYPRFLDFCRTALESIREGQSDVDCPLGGMFWLQGSSDSSKAKDANAYLANFQHFTKTFREDLAVPDMPVVVSPIIWSGKKVHVVNDALKQAGNSAVERCICIDPLDKDEFGVQGADAGLRAGHLTAAGLCEVGRRMGEAMPLPAGSELKN